MTNKKDENSELLTKLISTVQKKNDKEKVNDSVKSKQARVIGVDDETHKVFVYFLDDIEEKLKECKITFLRIHKSILVNFLFVTKIAKGQVILKNKVELPMSENGYKNIQKRFDGEDICNIDLN